MLGDVVWMKANMFQGKRKMKYRWDRVEYEIACQVANGSPSYETKDLSGKVKLPHCNKLFLVATPQVTLTALCQSKYANVHPTTHSALAEFTPLECDIDLARNTVKSDFPDTQPVLVHLDRWMAYDDHYLWWSRVQQQKILGME